MLLMRYFLLMRYLVLNKKYSGWMDGKRYSYDGGRNSILFKIYIRCLVGQSFESATRRWECRIWQYRYTHALYRSLYLYSASICTSPHLGIECIVIFNCLSFSPLNTVWWLSRYGIGKLYSYEELKLSSNISDNALQPSEKSAVVEPVTSRMVFCWPVFRNWSATLTDAALIFGSYWLEKVSRNAAAVKTTIY